MKEKTVSEAVAHRRSTRVYDPEQPIDSKVVSRMHKTRKSGSHKQ